MLNSEKSSGSSKTALIFPGQGSQSVGMLDKLTSLHPEIQDLFIEANSVLQYDLWQLITEGPEETLNQTEFTQVAMLVSDLAFYNVYKKLNYSAPKMLAGHSLGEYAALVAADVIDLKTAVSLVALRGKIMQQHVPINTGAMAAIVGLADNEVQSICSEASTAKYQVMPANYNAIGQVVIAGHTEAVLNAIKIAENSNARVAKIIPVSVPCHCELLKDASVSFAKYLQDVDFKSPKIPVISNVTARPYNSVDEIKDLLAKQLFSAVRWVETIQYFVAEGVTEIWEIGPGKVLSGLVKRIDKTLITHVIS